LEKSIELVESNRVPEHYEGNFIVERELIFLKEALNVLESNQSKI